MGFGVVYIRFLDFEVLEQDGGDCEAGPCYGTSLLQWPRGLLKQQFLKSVLMLPHIVCQIHHTQESHIFKFPGGRLSLET